MKIRLEPRDGEAWVDGTPVRLTPQEMVVLRRLLTARGHCVTSKDLAVALYGQNVEEEDLAVPKVLMFRLRRKGFCIQNRHGFGYRLAAEVEA